MSASDNLSSTQSATLYHVSQKDYRNSIETKGLKAAKPWEDEPKGVYMSQNEPHPQYGEDVYHITPNKGTTVHEDTGEWSNSVFIPRNLSTKEFKRVGHILHSPGKQEIHWHKEEDCPDK